MTHSLPEDANRVDKAPRYRHEALAVVLSVRSSGAGLGLFALATRRSRAPFSGWWALPSGPVETGETIDESVRRHLVLRTEVSELTHLEQLGTRSDPHRDPFQRTIATGYLGLVRSDANPPLPEYAAWLPVRDLPKMAFDHAAMVQVGVDRLRGKLSFTNIGFALAPVEFTMAQLRDIYQATLDHHVSVTNLQRILTRRSQLEPTGAQAGPGEHGGRPAALFRFTRQVLEITDQFATLRPTRSAGS